MKEEVKKKLDKYILHWADCGINDGHRCIYKNCPHEKNDKGYCTCEHDDNVKEIMDLIA